MEIENVNTAEVADKRIRRASPAQLLIFLTLAGFVFSSLFVAGFLGWSLFFAVSLGACALTFGRIAKKVWAKLVSLRSSSIKQFYQQNYVATADIYRFLDVYFAMMLVSGFCYSMGAAAQWLV